MKLRCDIFRTDKKKKKIGTGFNWPIKPTVMCKSKADTLRWSEQASRSLWEQEPCPQQHSSVPVVSKKLYFLHFNLKTLRTEGNIWSLLRFPNFHCSIHCWPVLEMGSWVGWVAGTFWLGELWLRHATRGFGSWRHLFLFDCFKGAN